MPDQDLKNLQNCPQAQGIRDRSDEYATKNGEVATARTALEAEYDANGKSATFFTLHATYTTKLAEAKVICDAGIALRNAGIQDRHDNGTDAEKEWASTAKEGLGLA